MSLFLRALVIDHQRLYENPDLGLPRAEDESPTDARASGFTKESTLPGNL
jgi:hypothetical protein